jgi:hypothetical protein
MRRTTRRFDFDLIVNDVRFGVFEVRVYSPGVYLFHSHEIRAAKIVADYLMEIVEDQAVHEGVVLVEARRSKVVAEDGDDDVSEAAVVVASFEDVVVVVEVEQWLVDA